MTLKKYLTVSSVIFALISLLHLLRVIFDWTFQVGSWNVPIWMSICAFILAGFLSLWAFKSMK